MSKAKIHSPSYGSLVERAVVTCGKCNFKAYTYEGVGRCMCSTWEIDSTGGYDVTRDREYVIEERLDMRARQLHDFWRYLYHIECYARGSANEGGLKAARIEYHDLPDSMKERYVKVALFMELQAMDQEEVVYGRTSSPV